MLVGFQINVVEVKHRVGEKVLVKVKLELVNLVREIDYFYCVFILQVSLQSSNVVFTVCDVFLAELS